jgi:hypothetical protein
MSKANEEFCGPGFVPIYGSHAIVGMTDNCSGFVGTSSESTDRSFTFYFYVGCGPTVPTTGS